MDWVAVLPDEIRRCMQHLVEVLICGEGEAGGSLKGREGRPNKNAYFIRCIGRVGWQSESPMSQNNVEGLPVSWWRHMNVG